MRSLFSIFFAVTLALLPVRAESESGSSSPLGGADTTVELPMLVAPVTVNGRLYHYAYMRVLLKAKDTATVRVARDKVPYIMDAMLREVHRESIALNGEPGEIDGNGLKERLLASANAAIGAGAFVSLTFRDTIQTDDPAVNAAAAASQPEPEPAEADSQTAAAH